MKARIEAIPGLKKARLPLHQGTAISVVSEKTLPHFDGLMNPVSKVIGALKSAKNHPVNRNRRWRAVIEYGFVQVAARLFPDGVCLRFPNQTRLLISPRMKGAAHFITPGLCEFEEMCFVMHFLRPSELFVDVGANVGAYTVLAAGATGADALSFEPGPETFAVLKRNVGLNDLAGRVRLVNAAVGRSPGTLRFSASLGTEDHVVSGTSTENSISVPVTSLDHELGGRGPALIKVDVEGFETEVFGGAERTLQNRDTQALIVERSDSGERYGYNEDKLHEMIRGNGFAPHRYEPFDRRLQPVSNEAKGNVIYVRDSKAAQEKLRTAPGFEFNGLRI